MMPVLSTRNSTLPALISLIACATFGVTVPVFGFGIRPRGPSTLPSRPQARIMSGVATTASKSTQPPRIFSTTSSPPTKSAPASVASRCLSPPAIASTFLLLPSPCGRTTVPRTIWSACFGSTPRRIASSTVSSNFANFTFCIKGTASSIVCGRSGTAARAAVYFFPTFGMSTSCGPVGQPALASHFCRFGNLGMWKSGNLRFPKLQISKLPDYVDSHRPGGAGDGLDRGFQRLAIQIGELGLGDLLDLLLRDRADLVLVRLGGSLR